MLTWRPRVRDAFPRGCQVSMTAFINSNSSQARYPSDCPRRRGCAAPAPTGPDEVTEGGLPLGRPTLVCGSVGCGKNLLGIEFLVCSTHNYGDSG